MKRKVAFLRAAKADVIEIHAYLLEQSPQAADSFVDDIAKATDLIASMPGIGRKWEHRESVRVTTVSRRFRNHLLFYVDSLEVIRIVAVLHGARDVQIILSGRALDS